MRIVAKLIGVMCEGTGITANVTSRLLQLQELPERVLKIPFSVQTSNSLDLSVESYNFSLLRRSNLKMTHGTQLSKAINDSQNLGAYKMSVQHLLTLEAAKFSIAFLAHKQLTSPQALSSMSTLCLDPKLQAAISSILIKHRQRTGCVVNGRPLAASKRAALQAVAADNSCRHQRIKEEERKTRHWHAPKQHPLIIAKKESEQRLLCGRSQVRPAVPSRTHATAFQTWATGFHGVGCNILKGDIDFMYDNEDNCMRIISRTAPMSELQHKICWATQVSISGKDELLWTAKASISGFPRPQHDGTYKWEQAAPVESCPEPPCAAQGGGVQPTAVSHAGIAAHSSQKGCPPNHCWSTQRELQTKLTRG
ncbi:hypothetical protein Anapl_12001 [Anas platyrhynchos]|uniref:Uncharacterized protein n=1 Tax=Anas platyrhynchos TaxID=8839 RepID=R0LBX1_ANAPL|nr:hypothetical protein Anapl_12001 [Anas platyrhynchos]